MTSKSYDWGLRNIAKVSPKMTKKSHFWTFFDFLTNSIRFERNCLVTLHHVRALCVQWQNGDGVLCFRSNGGIQYSSPWYDEDSIPMGDRASDEDEDVVCLEDLPLRERLRLQNIQCNDV